MMRSTTVCLFGILRSKIKIKIKILCPSHYLQKQTNKQTKTLWPLQSPPTNYCLVIWIKSCSHHHHFLCDYNSGKIIENKTKKVSEYKSYIYPHPPITIDSIVRMFCQYIIKWWCSCVTYTHKKKIKYKITI